MPGFFNNLMFQKRMSLSFMPVTFGLFLKLAGRQPG
jgi:hypothetical protein